MQITNNSQSGMLNSEYFITKPPLRAALLIRCSRFGGRSALPMVGLGFVTAYSALSAILEGIKGHGVALDLSALVFPEQIKGL